MGLLCNTSSYLQINKVNKQYGEGDGGEGGFKSVPIVHLINIKMVPCMEKII